MSGKLVVKAKAVAVEADLVNAAFYFDKCARSGFRSLLRCIIFTIDRKKRIDAERVFEIGEEKAPDAAARG